MSSTRDGWLVRGLNPAFEKARKELSQAERDGYDHVSVSVSASVQKGEEGCYWVQVVKGRG